MKVEHKDSIWWVSGVYLHSPSAEASPRSVDGWVTLIDGPWVCMIVAELILNTVDFNVCRLLERREGIQSERDYILLDRDEESLEWHGERIVSVGRYWPKSQMCWDNTERDVGEMSSDGESI